MINFSHACSRLIFYFSFACHRNLHTRVVLHWFNGYWYCHIWLLHIECVLMRDSPFHLKQNQKPYCFLLFRLFVANFSRFFSIRYTDFCFGFCWRMSFVAWWQNQSEKWFFIILPGQFFFLSLSLSFPLNDFSTFQLGHQTSLFICISNRKTSNVFWSITDFFEKISICLLNWIPFLISFRAIFDSCAASYCLSTNI